MKLLRFTAKWCQPCKVLARTLEEADISATVVDVDENNDAVVQYSIKSVPTLLLIDDIGNELSRLVGNHSKEQILNWVTNNS